MDGVGSVALVASVAVLSWAHRKSLRRSRMEDARDVVVIIPVGAICVSRVRGFRRATRAAGRAGSPPNRLAQSLELRRCSPVRMGRAHRSVAKGHGARFSFRLPIVDAEIEQITGRSAVRERAECSLLTELGVPLRDRLDVVMQIPHSLETGAKAVEDLR